MSLFFKKEMDPFLKKLFIDNFFGTGAVLIGNNLYLCEDICSLP